MARARAAGAASRPRTHVSVASFCRRAGDNAHAESFFHTRKAERTRGATFGTEPALRRELQRDIRYYNTVRLHSSLHDRSPLARERHAA